MVYDLTKATQTAEGSGYDLRKAAQMTAGGPIAMGRARQSAGGSSVHTVTKATAKPGGSADPKATPARKAKKKG